MTGMSFMSKENIILKAEITKLEHELQKRDLEYFYFKTLYDVNQEIALLNNTEGIINAFLMMIMGTFGIFQGFILLVDKNEGRMDFIESRDTETEILQPVIKFLNREHITRIFCKKHPLSFFDQKFTSENHRLNIAEKEFIELLTTAEVSTFVPFMIDERFSGGVALSKRISGEPFSQIDCELLSTLSKQLAINIQNAKSFEIIKHLNTDLRNKNRTLEETLEKIQLLEKAKTLLCKYVPKSLERIIEDHPESLELEKQEQDISVLFLDIEGFTAMSENLNYEEITRLIETYFSRFFDDIYRFGGDINMTAGDGLMIIFHNKDRYIHALNAVRTALAIKHRTQQLSPEIKGTKIPLVINIGIHSGEAYIGSTRLEGYYGSRWTYTALGSTVNMAARIGSFAAKGEILVSEETASRIREEFSLECVGYQRFKNVKKEVLLFRVIEVHSLDQEQRPC